MDTFGDEATHGDIDGPGFFGLGVVGESHYQRAIQRARGDASEGARVTTRAKLILEDDNPHDKQAVRIEIHGQTVGYLDRENARSYRLELKRAGFPRLVGSCAAKIVGGHTLPDGTTAMFGVLLDLPTTD